MMLIKLASETVVKYSGLQLQVLRLYREFLREICKRPISTEEKNALKKLVKNTFRKKSDWPKRDVDTIESWVRKGKGQLKLLRSSNVEGISVYNAK